MSVETIMDVKPEDCDSIKLDYYRKIVRVYLDLSRYKTAQFWAEKIATLSEEREQDVFRYAQSLFLSKQYHRAAHIIKSRNLQASSPQCAYLVATSLSAAKEYEEAMQTLGSPAFISNEDNTTQVPEKDLIPGEGDLDKINLLGNSLVACVRLERGRVYEAMDNREVAAEWFKQALMADIHCYEAFEALIQHQMLPASEETKLIASLPFNKHCPSQTDQDLVRYIYESRLNKYRSMNVLQASAPAWTVKRLENSLEQQVVDAERYYYNCHYSKCWQSTQKVMLKDPYHLECLPVHISCLVELKNPTELFLLAHRLVDIYPESGISWFAVGCYYYVIMKSEPTRRYLGKATALDRLFGPAWLAYGHSFAFEQEHDQAMAAYFKASQLMIGCHLPLLYIGLENGLTHNYALAEKFFQQALDIAPNDPFVLHEMGVIAFQSEQYGKALQHFEDALSKIKLDDKCILTNKWEPLLNNLGHVYRKLQMYDKAIECHTQAMLLMPLSYSTHAAIGFCEVLTGQTKKAVVSFHKALSLKRDDTFSTTMLNYVLDLLIQEGKEPVELDLDFSDILTPVAEKEKHEDEEFALKLLRSSCIQLSDMELASGVMSMEEGLVDVSDMSFDKSSKT